MELRILNLNFLVCSISGAWRPVHWTSKRSKLLYNMFTFVALYLFMYVFLTHLMYIIFVVQNLQQLASCAFLILSLINAWSKMITLVIRRDRIIELIEIIQEEPCKPCDEEEINIQMKFDRTIRSYSMPYVIMVSISGVNAIIGGAFFIYNNVIPFGFAWVPWHNSTIQQNTNFIFIITSVQEIAGIIIGAFLNVAIETTVLGFCLQICARFEILKYRIQKMIKQIGKECILTSPSNNISNRTSRFSEHVSHHLCIIRLAEMTNDVFGQVIFAQFSTSILILCTVIYHVYFHATLADIVSLSAFTFCMFVQIFYYCWGGNEVTLKSAGFGNEVYNMDWVCMTVSEQKDLLMIMKRSTRPIKFTSSFLVTLSLESFSNLLKASFSAFNLMQQF